jgi:hypothetical protein
MPGEITDSGVKDILHAIMTKENVRKNSDTFGKVLLVLAEPEIS